ncbi:MAG: hypothetical protein O2856_06335, partial [Planctomycetota bacterium]|nr:hypothetical protein [Planctomycetota bacterium]
ICIVRTGLIYLPVLLWTLPTFGQQTSLPQTVQHPNFRIPDREYVDVPFGERVIKVEKQLIDEAPVVAKKTIERLKFNINLALDILPRHSHPYVGKQQFWLMYGPKSKGGGENNGASYFRPGSSEFNELLDVNWNSVVVVYHAQNYLDLSDMWALKVILHELGHAYQLEQWPEQEASILSAYDNAMAEKLYRNVPEDTGATIESAYATVNQLEYFAELTCMYFGRCNYRPMNRSELKNYDATGYRMIRQMWKDGDEYGQHGIRNWRIANAKKPFEATFKSVDGSRVVVALEDGKERKLNLKSLNVVDQDYIQRWKGE